MNQFRRKRIKIVYADKSTTYTRLEGGKYIKLRDTRRELYYIIQIEREGDTRLFIDLDYIPIVKIHGNYKTGRNIHKIIRSIR